ncbi:hypothetical protein BH23THE1_BH23THE1_28820 [soil metagenome]
MGLVKGFVMEKDFYLKLTKLGYPSNIRELIKRLDICSKVDSYKWYRSYNHCVKIMIKRKLKQ